MLAKEYQNYVRAIYTVAGAQVKAKGKFRTSSVLKHSHVKAAAAGAYALTMATAAISPAVTAKFVNAEIAKMTFSAFKKVHKSLKKQGLAMMLPAAAIGTTVIAEAPQAQSPLLRREFIGGASAVALLAGLTLTPSAASAGDTALWAVVKKQVAAFLAAETGAMAKAVTG